MPDTQDTNIQLLEKKFNRRELVIGAGKTAVTAAVATTLTGINQPALAQTGAAESAAAGSGYTRAYMEGMVDKYIAAVVAHDPGLCPLTNDVVFVENQQVLPVGDGGWQNLNRFGSYRHYFCDFEMDQVGLIANAYENDRGCVYVLRLKIDNGRISQIDQWISRDPNGCENYEKLGAPDPIWLEPIPQEQRQSREALMMNAFMYFEALERNDGSGIYPFRPDCERIEHARRTVSQKVNSGYGHADVATKFVTMPARAQYEYGMMAFVTRIRDRQSPVIDVERGAVMGQGTYDFDGALKKIHFIKDDVDWTIPPYFRTARSHMATEAFKVIKGSFRYIEMTFLEVPFGTREHWLGRPMTVKLTYEPTRPKPKPVKANSYDSLVALNQQVLDAIINDCPCQLPLADDVRYTENGVPFKPGWGGLWKTIKGMRNYSIHLADPETQQAAWVGTLNENGLLAAVAMRVKVKDGYISEIENIIARPEKSGQWGELAGATFTMFVPHLLSDLNEDGFDRPAAALLKRTSRASRKSLTDTVDAYFNAYSKQNSSLAPLAANCVRRENGRFLVMQNGVATSTEKPLTDTSGNLAGWLDAGFLAGLTSISQRRNLLVDRKQGLVLNLALLNNSARNKTVAVKGAGSVPVPDTFLAPWTDLHAQLFKITSGKITHIEDLVRRVPYGQGSGWTV